MLNNKIQAELNKSVKFAKTAFYFANCSSLCKALRALGLSITLNAHCYYY